MRQRSEQLANQLDGRPAPRLTLQDVVDARAKLSASGANGCSGVVGALLKVLPLTFLFVLLQVFQDRFAGVVVEDVKSWSTIVLILLNKIPNPAVFDHFRGISLLDVVSKLYMGCLMRIVARYPAPKSWSNVCSFAYEKGKNASQVGLAIMSIMAKSWECRGCKADCNESA